MKNIKLFSLVLLSIIFFSCKKEKDEPAKPKTKTELLTARTWMYDEYFRSYNNSNTILYYKRGKSNNLLNYDQSRNTYRADGTYTEITSNGSSLSGTWRFLNNEVQIQVVNSFGTYTSTIMALDEGRFYWLEPNADNGTYGKMIPQ